MALNKRTYVDQETVITADNLNDIQDEIIQNAADITTKGTYSKPSGGIPASDLASGVQTSLGKADTAYQKPSGGIPSTDMASAVQTSLDKADSAYQKPQSGIPSTDLASAVQTSLEKANTALQSSDIDNTLTVTGKAADAKKTGDEISGLKNTLNDQRQIYNVLPQTRYWSQVQKGNPCTIYGRTYMIQPNGEILVTGAGTSTSTYYLSGVVELEGWEGFSLPAGTYIFKLKEDISSYAIVGARRAGESSWSMPFSTSGNEYTFDDTTPITIGIAIAKNTVLPEDGLLVQPMIYRKNDGYFEYIAPWASLANYVPHIIDDLQDMETKDISELGYTALTQCHERGIYRTGSPYLSSITDMPAYYNNGPFNLYVTNPAFASASFAKQRLVSLDSSAWERIIYRTGSNAWTVYSNYDWKKVYDSSYIPAKQSDMDYVISLTIDDKEYSTAFISGGFGTNWKVNSDNTRIRTVGADIPSMKTGDRVIIDEPYEGVVIASIQPGYGKYVYGRITDDWVTGSITIPEEYDGKYIGVLIRKIGHINDDISADVATIGDYVKFHRVTSIAQNNEINMFSGLNISILGDSISAFAGYIPITNTPYYGYNGNYHGVTSVNQMWWKILADSTGANLLVMNAWSGSAITQLEDSSHSSITPMSDDSRCYNLHAYVESDEGEEGAIEITSENIESITTSPFFPEYTPTVGDYVKRVDPDIVIIAGGTNDYSYAQSAQSEPLEWDGKTGPVLDNSFTEAYACMIKKIQYAYPSAIIVALSTWFTMRGTDNGYTYTHTVGSGTSARVYTQKDYNDAIREVAEQMHIPYIDVSNIGFNRNNYYPNYANSDTSGGVSHPTHPIAAGQYVIGRAITRKIIPLVKGFKEH